MPSPKRTTFLSKQGWLLLGVIVFLGYFTFLHNYTEPSKSYWDESYHITAAQKYLNGVFFMEQHPPLGKLIIAAGEKMIGSNSDEVNSALINGETTKDVEVELDLRGYRFFPSLLALITTILLFFIFLKTTKNEITAALLSFLFIFDTAIPVVSSAALLESPLLFFIALTILAFLHLLDCKKINSELVLLSILFGTAIACATLTKLTGLFLILLLPILFFKNWSKIKLNLVSIGVSCISVLIFILAAWHVHFLLTKNVNSELSKDGFYNAKGYYREILEKDEPFPFKYYPYMILDNYIYAFEYNKGVPGLDLCKPVEAGSPWFYWPTGARPITFLSEKIDEETGRYMMFMPNPVVWWLGGISVFIALSYFICSFLFKIKLKERFLIGTFLALYFGYLFGVSLIPRVMYLTHYLPPLIISFVLLALVLNELKQIGSIKINNDRKYLLILVIALTIFLSHQYFRPLTTLEPMTKPQVQRRAFLSLWELKCIDCEVKRPFFVPKKCEENGDGVNQKSKVEGQKLGQRSKVKGLSTFDFRPNIRL